MLGFVPYLLAFRRQRVDDDEAPARLLEPYLLSATPSKASRRPPPRSSPPWTWPEDRPDPPPPRASPQGEPTQPRGGGRDPREGGLSHRRGASSHRLEERTLELCPSCTSPVCCAGLSGLLCLFMVTEDPGQQRSNIPCDASSSKRPTGYAGVRW